MQNSSVVSAQAGFSLIELLLVLAILVAILSAAAPGLGSLVDRIQLRAHLARLHSAVELARSEAVRRRETVSLCPTTAISSTRCDGSYAGGWMVFSNPDRDDELDAGSDELLRYFPPLPSRLTAWNGAASRPAHDRITYWPDGSTRQNLTLMLCPPSASNARGGSLVINSVGRARLEYSSGACR